MMISPVIAIVVSVVLISYSVVSYFIWVKVRSYGTLMGMLNLMVVAPLFILTLDITESAALTSIIILEFIMAFFIGIRYRQSIGQPYNRMIADMIRIVDNQSLNIDTLAEIDSSGGLRKLHFKQLAFIEMVRDMLISIQIEHANIEGHLGLVDSQIKKMSEEISLVTNDVDQILQNAAILSESINELRNSTINFIDKTNSDFDILIEISNAADRITDQTNIIAVNAAIEAAQSEEGSNFATVADSIQSLSSRSRSTTDRLFRTITSLKRETIKELETINQDLDSLEEMMFSLGELANRSSSFSHSQESLSAEINSLNNQAKEANDRLQSSFNLFKLD